MANLKLMAKKHNKMMAESWRKIYLEVKKQHPELATWQINDEVNVIIQQNKV